MELKIKSKSQLEMLGTKRLLAYYKAERQRFISFEQYTMCTCGCGMHNWELHSMKHKFWNQYQEEKITYKMWSKYLKDIKAVLGTREHVKNTVKTKK